MLVETPEIETPVNITLFNRSREIKNLDELSRIEKKQFLDSYVSLNKLIEKLNEPIEEDGKLRTKEYTPVGCRYYEIVAAVCRGRKCTIKQLQSKSRKREIVYARQILMYVASKKTRLSFKAIGERLGGRDHTTVLHSRDTITDLMYIDENIKMEVCLYLNMF